MSTARQMVHAASNCAVLHEQAFNPHVVFDLKEKSFTQKYWLMLLD